MRLILFLILSLSANAHSPPMTLAEGLAQNAFDARSPDNPLRRDWLKRSGAAADVEALNVETNPGFFADQDLQDIFLYFYLLRMSTDQTAEIRERMFEKIKAALDRLEEDLDEIRYAKSFWKTATYETIFTRLLKRAEPGADLRPLIHEISRGANRTNRRMDATFKFGILSGAIILSAAGSAGVVAYQNGPADYQLPVAVAVAALTGGILTEAAHGLNHFFQDSARLGATPREKAAIEACRKAIQPKQIL